jgi:hypothetical protein
MILFRNLAYIAGLAVFYYKYVPLVWPFQLVLVPILLLAAGVTWMDFHRGTMFFLFAFPLINNLPYFFGISEPFPHAPAALVLFLFFFLGVLLSRDPAKNEDVLGPSLTKPLLVFALIVTVSAAVTFFRYTNFFPLHGLTIYEIKTNTFGVSAGGAIMSVVFQALNYLTGLAFFLILSRTVRTKKSADEALSVLVLSSFLSLGFALLQYYGHGRLGNNPTSYLHQLINGTFKDAMSFGAYLSMAAPMFLGMFFAARLLWKKIFSGAVVLLSFFLILYTGSKIGLFSLIASSVCFAVWGAIAEIRLNRGSARGFRRNVALGIGALVVAGIAAGAVVFQGPILARAGKLKIVERLKDSRNMFNWRIQAQWGPAIKMMADYPLTGTGIGGFIIESANYTDVYRTSGAVPESAENFLLQVGSELGIAGILAVIWIALVLFREIRRGFRAKAKSADSWRVFLSIGAASGILAFVLNSQMHSYIGSYEIKYMLWFLIGLLFCLSRWPEEENPADLAERSKPTKAVRGAEGRPFRRRVPIAVGVMIIVFGGAHLWNSTHSLSLQSRTEKLGLIQDFGLYAPEKTPDGREFRWTREYGGIPVKFEKSALSLPIHASHPDIKKKPVRVRIYLVKDLFKHKTFLKEIILAQNDWQDVALSVPPEDIGQEAILLLKISRTWNPLKTKGVPDPRNLGVAVGKIEFRNR